MSKVSEIDKEITKLSVEKDRWLADHKAKVAELKAERASAVVADRVADMSDAEKEAMKVALEGDK